jgi:hypothetical protein
MANELHFSWPSLQPAHLGGDDRLGASILANLLALPEQTYQDRVGTAQMRAVARSMGVPEEQLNTVMPGEDVPTPVGGTGIVGKIMSGVGKTGAVLSSILGAPVKPPRFGPTEIKDLEEGAAKESLIGTLSKDDPDYAKKAAKIRLGKYDEVFPGAPKNIMQLAQAEADRQGLTGGDRYNFIRDQVVQMTGMQTQARTDVTTQADIDKKNAEIDKQNETIRQWNQDHPEAQRPETPHLNLSSTGAGGPAGGTTQPGGDMGGGGGGGGGGNTVAIRNNNPGNITASPATLHYPGVVGTETVGSRTFLKFDSPESGYAGMERLLQTPGYSTLSFGNAMRRWTTGTTAPTFDAAGRPVGYDLPAMSRRLGIDPSQSMAALSPDQRRALVREMSVREGFRPGGGAPASAQPGAQPAGPVQVAANVQSDTASDVGGAGAIGIPPDAVTDQQGNVYNRTDLTKPLGKVNPAKPGTMIKAKETLGPTGVTTETVNPRAAFEGDKERNMAKAQLQQEQQAGANVDPENEQQVYDRMARNSQGMRGVTEADLAEAAVNHKPGEPWQADQARKVLQILKNKGGETGPGAILARVELQRADNAQLMQPVPKTDPNTGEPLKDRNGKPLYAMWTDPSDGIRKPIRPVDVAITNWMVTHTPFAPQINIQQMEADPDFHLAAMMLDQAQSNLTRWATLKGDAKRIAETERKRMEKMVPQIGDTKQQAIDKLTLGNQALDRMEAQARRELALTDVIPESATGAPAPAAPAAPAPAAPSPRPAAPRQLKNAPKGFTIEPMGAQ